ncbi:hypothetical protein BKA00_003800 [Actinomadura coerulea]|uniref:Uncharacterized protein n=1 Tax=Actinomadura coerulea TaxID=46159 RepID=A0A7X0KZV2_9ACTN|nr:hypothetical protein [Actinomadura coerulea]MBB6396886.1 hypothetical protein [Actinomadura coerulea]GGP95097.1 hypothetical protein GCM10010187_08240 [Actinomadura coerulea]
MSASPNTDRPDLPGDYDPAAMVELKPEFEDGAWEWKPMRLVLLQEAP